MPRKCLVCNSKPVRNISLFQFLPDNPRRLEWANFAAVSANTLRPTDSICSKHFTSDLFKWTVKDGCRRALKPHATPTIQIIDLSSSSEGSNDSQNDNVSFQNCNKYCVSKTKTVTTKKRMTAHEKEGLVDFMEQHPRLSFPENFPHLSPSAEHRS